MNTRALGRTGLTVSELGLGAGPLGGAALDDAAAVRLIHGALELGITLIDTAPSYGRSELRVGEALRGRRDRVVVSTKLGYGVPGVPDWTGPCIRAGVDAALARLRTDWLDLAHLHSCPLEVLEREDVLDAVGDVVRAGKVRVAAYSGDNAPLTWAIASGRFGAVQCSINLADQRALDAAVPRAHELGLGVLAKRTLANGAWREPHEPAEPDRAEYWRRLVAMQLLPAGGELAARAQDRFRAEMSAPGEGIVAQGEARRGSVPAARDRGATKPCAAGPSPARSDLPEAGLRFVLAQPGVSSALVGTTSLPNLTALAEAAARGPLDAGEAAELRAAFRRNDRGWDGVI